MKDLEKAQEALPFFHLSIPDNNALARCYMPFARNGGLFIPDAENYALGDPVFLLLKLPGSDNRHAVQGKVFWISPPGSSRGAGIGVRFSKQDNPVSRLIAAQ